MKPSSPSTAFFSAVAGMLLLVFLCMDGWGASQGLCRDMSLSESNQALSSEPEHAEDQDVNIGAWFASSVWQHISAVDGERCPSEPTCSSYSAQVFKKHGFFIGWVMTVDRLIHEADEGRNSPLVKRDGVFKIFDPVHNNDFWWYGGDETSQD